MQGRKWALSALFALASAMLITGCQVFTKEIVVTRVVTETIVEQETIIEQETIFEQETIIIEVTPTPQPVEVGPRTLVICQGEEPETLYIYDDPTLAAQHVQEAIYDGPIDNRSYGYQPVILEKLPSLADGDAVIQTVIVETGDLVVDDVGAPVTLEEGILIRPAGCYSSECAVAFDGNPVEMEQLAVTFRLKEGILWSDGEPLTAYDSVYSFDILKDPDTPADRFTIHRTASYEALDGYTIVWTGLPGFRDGNYFVNFWSPLPEHLLGDFTALELIEAEESSKRPMGRGPYIITEWVSGDHITLVKNENYWRADEGLPRFDTVILRFVGQNSEANVTDLLAGECDILDQTSGLEDYSGLLLELQAVGLVNVAFSTMPIWEHADFGIEPVPGYDRPDFFADVRTRQAIAYCMDRQQVVDEVMFGQSIVPDTYVPPEHPLFNPNVKQYEFDVEKGSALLEEVGWIDDDGDPTTPRVAQGVEGVRNGTPLEFNYWTSDTTSRRAVAQLLQASLGECGINVNVEYWDRFDFVLEGPDGPLFGRYFDIGQFAWLAGVDPRCDLYLSTQIPSEETGWDGPNVSGFVNEEYDSACNAALELLPGQPEYAQYHLEAQRIFAEQLPAVPLYLHFKLAASRPDLRNFYVDPTESEMWNIEAFDYGE
jgi:peptide/nickel transport system substrate-binding protein